ncbi:MAG: bifunctional diaminohydroxyphosphoribosylaminopyrimidine deaminase/5-amino-6-(5-phosphoribosylamino)uracil reductase RibD, partial [Chitinophagales bacterium]|nr:bifunctional diaminohydroxyphosphoribosylaminopyrimidine deaminase/5-amino-6-(5-phosphoribosylamino)uracil reductase RibD [Chitinophagales bacterium]
LLQQSTLYVNLEPCSHFGKTPPCADLIIEKKIPRAVIGCADPNPLVSGRGIEKLRLADCELQIGILEKESQELNKRFFTFYEKKRPYVILKWAQTSDGFLAPQNRSRMNISNDYSRKLMHEWRSEETAIMVGKNTALFDNPKLDSKIHGKKNPLRIVLDKNLELPSSLNLFDHTIPSIVFTEKNKENETNLEFVQMNFGNSALHNMLSILYERKIQSVIVEGGAMLLESFIKEGLWDEARIFKAARHIENGISAPQINGIQIYSEKILTDQLIILKNNQ